MKKRLPKMKSDKAAEKLLEKDLSEFLDPENFALTSFEFAPKDKSITIRVSEPLLQAVKAVSKKKGVSYQKYVRQALERALKKDAA